MLEIVLLILLVRKVGRVVEAKGRPSLGFKAMTVVLWVCGELTGAAIGVAAARGTSDGQCAIFAFALVGAAFGAAVSYVIAVNAGPATQGLEVGLSGGAVATTPTTCGSCRADVALDDEFCSRCGTRAQHATVTEERDYVCMECGARVSEEAVYCPACGSNVEDIVEDDDPSDAVPGALGTVPVCANCGAEIYTDIGSLFDDEACSQCGSTRVVATRRTELSEGPGGAEESGMRCGECGQINEADSRFCISCGTALRGAEAPAW